MPKKNQSAYAMTPRKRRRLGRASAAVPRPAPFVIADGSKGLLSSFAASKMGSAEDALAAPRSSGFASDAGAEQVSAGAPRSQAAKLRPTTTRRAVADGGAMNERELGRSHRVLYRHFRGATTGGFGTRGSE